MYIGDIMNNKGFTLSEVIVTVAILSIIMLMAFPAITKLQTSNQQQVYETYEKVLLNGAKLYVDKYGRDLWQSNANGVCVSITYDDLIFEDLIKKYSGREGEVIVTDNSYVNATKKNNTVTYSVALLIKDKNGSVLHEKKATTNICQNYHLGR